MGNRPYVIFWVGVKFTSALCQSSFREAFPELDEYPPMVDGMEWKFQFVYDSGESAGCGVTIAQYDWDDGAIQPNLEGWRDKANELLPRVKATLLARGISEEPHLYMNTRWW